MLKWIPIPGKVRHFLGRNLLRFNSWRRERQLRNRIRACAAKAIKQLQSMKNTLPPGRSLVGILLTEHFGDIVACEPVIPWLKEHDPDAFVVWLMKPAYSELLKNHPELGGVVEINSVLGCVEVIRSGILDQVVDLHLNQKLCTVFGRNLLKTWGNPEVNGINYYHYGALLEAFSSGAGLPRIVGQPQLFVSFETRCQVDALNLPAKYVVFHARSNELTRNWVDTRWSELAKILIARFGLIIVEVGLAPILTPDRTSVINLCGKLTLLETAEVIRRASHYFGIDSGPAHLANAFRIPSTILLGRYHAFESYMPYTGYLRNHADAMVIQWQGPVAEITVAEVLRRYELVSGLTPIAPNNV